MKFAQEGASEFAPIEIELYNKALPKTCENFLKLCQGVEGWVEGHYLCPRNYRICSEQS